MVDYMMLGRRIRAKRRSMRLSQEEVSKAVNISPSFYSNIERGIRIPSIDTLVAIANALDVGLDFLLMDSLSAGTPSMSREETQMVVRYLRERMAELVYDEEPSEQAAPPDEQEEHTEQDEPAEP